MIHTLYNISTLFLPFKKGTHITFTFPFIYVEARYFAFTLPWEYFQ